MTSILEVLFVIILNASAPASTPPTTTPAPTATSTTNNCWCQTMPGKDWGK